MCKMGTQDPQSRILHLIWRLSYTYNFVWKCILENIFCGEKTGQFLHKKRFLQICSTLKRGVIIKGAYYGKICTRPKSQDIA